MSKNKIGRNSPCSCGSGFKYKKCCLNKQSKGSLTKQNHGNSVAYQPHQLIIHKYFSENHFDLLLEKSRLEKTISGELTMPEKDPAEFLKEYLNICENKIQSIAEKHSIYELIFWSRRFGPKNIFNVSESTVLLYKEVQTLSIYKYGKAEEKFGDTGNYGIVPENVTGYYQEKSSLLFSLPQRSLETELVDILSDVIRIEILSYLYVYTTQVYRIINKGGNLVYNKKSGHLSCSTEPELDYLINLYDNRLSKANLLSITGSYLEDKVESTDEKEYCPYFQLNVDNRLSIPLFQPSPGKEENVMAPNYVLTGFNLKSAYSFLKLFETEFLKEYNFRLRTFLIFLAHLGHKITTSVVTSLNFQLHIFNRAYTIINQDISGLKDEVIDNYINLYSSLFQKKVELDEGIKEELNLIIDQYTLNSSDRDLNLWTRGPKRIFYQLHEEKLLLDFTSMSDILSYLVKKITTTDGPIGNLRAISFESAFGEALNKNFKKENVWVISKEINSPSGKKEIDGSFVIDDVLFLGEAKAVNLSLGFEKGDKVAVNYRINKMKKAIMESNEKADFIKNNYTELDIKLPKQVRYICPFVISSYPEYVWENNSELFISKELDLPRILTINDISNMKNINLNELKKKSWVRKL